MISQYYTNKKMPIAQSLGIFDNSNEIQIQLILSKRLAKDRILFLFVGFFDRKINSPEE